MCVCIHLYNIKSALTGLAICYISYIKICGLFYK